MVAPMLEDMVLSRLRSKESGTRDHVAPPGRAEKMKVRATHRVLGTPMTGPFPDTMEQLIVGMGCFWGVEQLYWKLEGVYTTAAGYSGGVTPNPNYDETSSGSTGHAEAVLVVFDPAIVDLQKLLTVFWENHDPTTPYRSTGFSSQYRSAIFTMSPEQHQAALASKEHYQARLRDRGYSKIHTEINEASEFYYAEDYHQQYMHTHPRALCGHGFCQVSYS